MKGFFFSDTKSIYFYRFNVNAFYDPDMQKKGKMNSKWGGFVDNIELFDADFWGISPREAERLDPQQRMMLEVWAIYLANLIASDCVGSVRRCWDCSFFFGWCKDRNICWPFCVRLRAITSIRRKCG